MTELNAQTISSIDTVPIPAYDRAALTTGIVHFGMGNFHRAHQAMYLDRLMNKGKALNWAICGVGVMEADRQMRDALIKQDFLYTLVLKHPDGKLEPRVIGSVREYLFAPDDPEAVLKKLTSPATKIVSLTITEGGYNIDHVTEEFDSQNSAVQRDLNHASAPATVFGFIVEALRRRRFAGFVPFVVMSCDNIQGNGDVARRSIIGYARLLDLDLAAWIDATVSFPNSMVDRITPATTEDDRELVATKYGIDDEWPVVSEPFTQWVLEDKFPTGRPAYESVGVQLVDDVEPYELMKLRLLNASHQAIAYFGYLSGYRYVHEAANDPLIVDLLLQYMDKEATPTLRPVPGIDLSLYKRTLLERFANPEIRDTLARLATDASDRIPKWLLPVVRENIAANGPVTRSAAVVASWARYLESVDESGNPIDVVDRLRDQIVTAAQSQRPNEFISTEALFGELSRDERFSEGFNWTLSLLHDGGAQATLRALASSAE